MTSISSWKVPSQSGVHRAAVVGRDLRQRLEVERLQGPSGLDVGEVVGDEQLSIDQPDVGLDRGEPVVESVEQWTLVLVVVVGVGLLEGAAAGASAVAEVAGEAVGPTSATPASRAGATGAVRIRGVMS
ncbi:hypothetical protein [Nocardioides sp. B-3]|uniref:hypothetical protein n=1 Tax=Nocardioides sp. B-3 TaxID=2895565 RepID=UPI0021525148|nr:hypothetical protein [Nocardioides sp. B-3]UUZ60104.1 hypothetical protein LP418_03795 [Nocardioides sp. B-3]